MSRRFELMRLLEGYVPSRPEARAHAQMVVLAKDSGDVLSRYHFRPGHFTASAFVTSLDGGSLLLIHHERLGKWLQPGGHIEPGDSDLEAAVLREVAEETGLTDLEPAHDGLFDIDVHEIPAAKGEPHHEHHDLRFLYTATGDPAPGAGIRDVAWIPLDTIPDVTTDHSVLRAVRKLEGRS